MEAIFFTAVLATWLGGLIIDTISAGLDRRRTRKAQES